MEEFMRVPCRDLGGIARHAGPTPQRSDQWPKATRQGRERAAREAIDGETGVIPSKSAISPSLLPFAHSVSASHE